MARNRMSPTSAGAVIPRAGRVSSPKRRRRPDGDAARAGGEVISTDAMATLLRDDRVALVVGDVDVNLLGGGVELGLDIGAADDVLEGGRELRGDHWVGGRYRAGHGHAARTDVVTAAVRQLLG